MPLRYKVAMVDSCQRVIAYFVFLNWKEPDLVSECHSSKGQLPLISFVLILIAASYFARVVPCISAQQAKKPFTVADDIGLA